MRHVDERGLNNFQSFSLRARSPRRSAGNGKTKPAESRQLNRRYFQRVKNVIQTPTKEEEEGRLSICWSFSGEESGWESQESRKGAGQGKEERWWRGRMQKSAEHSSESLLVFTHLIQKSFRRRFGLRRRNRFLNMAKKIIRSPSVTGLLGFCFSAGVGVKSSGALPPVGGAQQSQVVVGGTEALLKRRRGRRLGSRQHLCVLKQVGKCRVRSSRSVFYRSSGCWSFFTSRAQIILKVFHPRRETRSIITDQGLGYIFFLSSPSHIKRFIILSEKLESIINFGVLKKWGTLKKRTSYSAF